MRTCPFCFTPLEPVDVTPCMLCGAKKMERAHLHTHTYAEMELDSGIHLVLCDFCQLDIGSYTPSLFGLKSNRQVYNQMRLIRSVEDVQITKDKYCPECGFRLALLRQIKGFIDDERA